MTATAALDTGKFTPTRRSTAQSPKTISRRAAAQLRQRAASAPSTSPTRSRNSVNTVWAQVGEKLGKPTMVDYMERFGFDREAAARLPGRPEGAPAACTTRNGRLLDPTQPLVDVGRVAIGQDKLRVTPLQMAMVAAAVANGGG